MKIHGDIRYQKLIKDIEAFHIEGNVANMEEALNQLQVLAEIDQDAIGLAASYFYRAILASRSGRSKDKVTFIEKSYALAVSKKIPYYEMKACNCMGIYNSEDADFYSSLKYYLSAYHIAKEHPEFKYEGIVLNNLGNLFVWLNEYEAAVFYLIQAYEKYMEDQIDDRLFLVVLIVNIIEMYSGIKDYEKVAQWYNKEHISVFNEEELLILNSILVVNDVVKATMNKDFGLAKKMTHKFIAMADKADDFIYIFRCYLNTLKASLESGDEKLCLKLIKKMQILNDKAPMDTFYYDFANLKVQFHKQYKARRTSDSNPDFDFYYVQSIQKIKQLEHTYARSLFAEIELDKSHFENKNILAKNKQLQKDVELDLFTGLYNKTSTINHVKKQLEKRGKNSCQAMLIIDIDYFKHVNDYYGHGYGDKVIGQIASILKYVKSETKIVGRFGGDEYLIFFPSLKKPASIFTTLDNIYKEVYQIPIPDDRIEKLTLSMGISLVHDDITFEQLFKQTDQALYHAKEKGRNQYALYDSQKTNPET